IARTFINSNAWPGRWSLRGSGFLGPLALVSRNQRESLLGKRQGMSLAVRYSLDQGQSLQQESGLEVADLLGRQFRFAGRQQARRRFDQFCIGANTMSPDPHGFENAGRTAEEDDGQPRAGMPRTEI